MKILFSRPDETGGDGERGRDARREGMTAPTIQYRAGARKFRWIRSEWFFSPAIVVFSSRARRQRLFSNPARRRGRGLSFGLRSLRIPLVFRFSSESRLPERGPGAFHPPQGLPRRNHPPPSPCC